MGRPKLYNSTDEAKQAENQRKQRYKTEKTVSVQAFLKPEYAQKIEAITEKLQCSKAEVMRMGIDRLYNELFPNDTV